MPQPPSHQLPPALKLRRTCRRSSKPGHDLKTKEEIFLQLYVQQLRQWINHNDSVLANHPGPLSPHEFAEITTSYILDNPLLLKMGSIARGVLEENTDERIVFETKMQLAGLLVDCGSQINRKFPNIPLEAASRLDLQIYALISGMWQLYVVSDRVRDKLIEADITIFTADFKESVVEAVATFVKGAIS